MVQDRRRSRRFSMVDLELQYQGSGEHVGRVVNLSQGGMLINAIVEFKKGENVDLRITFDKPIEGKINFDFMAEVAWCMQETPDTYGVGLQFSKNAELQYQFLQKLISLYGSPAA